MGISLVYLQEGEDAEFAWAQWDTIDEARKFLEDNFIYRRVDEEGGFLYFNKDTVINDWQSSHEEFTQYIGPGYRPAFPYEFEPVEDK